MNKTILRIIFVISPLVIMAFTFSSKENIEQRQSYTKGTTISNNENLLAKSLLYTNWISVSDLWQYNYDQLREALIAELDTRTGESLTFLQGLSDEDLAYSSILYKFLLDAGIQSTDQMTSLTLDDLRNTVIVQNNNNTAHSIQELQGFDNKKNLNIAYGWWFNDDGTLVKQMSNQLKRVTAIRYGFDRKDNRGVNLEVLKIVKADEADYTYLGVYHSMVSSNHFKLYLAGSNNLMNWTFITELGDRAHQGDIVKWGSGYILANEQDVVEGSNNIQVRYYASYQDLKNNIPANRVSLNREFSPSAEGTPDIRLINGDSPTNSYIQLGFHFYDNNIVDQQAFGILRNFCDWKAWKDEISNYNLKEMGYNGNLGSRSSFEYQNNTYLLQEAQLEKNDWSAWRLMLGDGTYYFKVSPETPKGSVSFANPGIEYMGDNTYAVTSFLPTEGNQSGEIGEMMYQVNFNQ